MLKTCTKCKIEQDISCFYKRGNSFRSACKACKKIEKKEYREKNQDKINKTQKEYYENNKVKIKEYRLSKRDHLTVYQRNYKRKRRASDTSFKLTLGLSARIRKAIKQQAGEKAYKTIELLGCTVEFAAKYLESKFQPEMTWDNYGFGDDKWNIDHIRPCASFDLSDPEQQKQCFHYTNLQPLWQKDNFLKRDKWLNDND